MNDMLPLFFGESNIDIFSKKKKEYSLGYLIWNVYKYVVYAV